MSNTDRYDEWRERRRQFPISESFADEVMDLVATETPPAIASAEERTLDQSYRRTVMFRRLSRVAAVAAIVILFIVVANRLADSTDVTSKVWAAEQTTTAMKKIDSIYMAGTVREGELVGRFELWCRANADHSRFGSGRIEVEDMLTIVSLEEEDVAYMYNRHRNAVMVTNSLKGEKDVWFGAEYISRLMDASDGWQWQQSYESDAETGKRYVVVKGSYEANASGRGRSSLLRIDLETNLPERMAVWGNANFEGDPEKDATTIVYDAEIPEGTFEFEIPAGAQVIDRREKSNSTE